MWLQVIRDIDIGNVVSTLTGAQRRWTLLEYCAVAGNGADSNSVPVRKTPPEVRSFARNHPCLSKPACSTGRQHRIAAHLQHAPELHARMLIDLHVQQRALQARC